MAKSEGQRAVVTWGGAEIGVSDFSIDTQISELDVTDTKTSVGESEFLGAKQERTISFTIYKDATVDGLDLNTSTAVTIAVTDASANTSTYAGNAILLSESVTGSVDGVVTVAYSGRFTGAVTETQT